MRKLLYVTILFLVFAACTEKEKKDPMLIEMEKAVKHHIMLNDAEKGIITDLKYIVPISYEQIPENGKQQPDDVYLGKVYLQGKSSYVNSSRIYNIDDTLTCYFDKDVKFLRWDKKDDK